MHCFFVALKNYKIERSTKTADRKDWETVIYCFQMNFFVICIRVRIINFDDKSLVISFNHQSVRRVVLIV